MTPASMVVSVSMTGHHIVEEQSVERSLGVWIVMMMVLFVRERILLVAILIQRQGGVDLIQVVLEFRVSELDRRYRVDVVVLAHNHLAAIRPQVSFLPRVRRILDPGVR